MLNSSLNHLSPIASICGTTTIGGSYTTCYVTYTTSPNGTGGNLIGNFFLPEKKEITIFDKKFTIDTGNDILIILAQLDFLGIGFYESLKNMNLHNGIPSEVCSFLEAELKKFKRSEKIKKALTKNDKS